MTSQDSSHNSIFINKLLWDVLDWREFAQKKMNEICLSVFQSGLVENLTIRLNIDGVVCRT